jgi:hypothetical protein
MDYDLSTAIINASDFRNTFSSTPMDWAPKKPTCGSTLYLFTIPSKIAGILQNSDSFEKQLRKCINVGARFHLNQSTGIIYRAKSVSVQGCSSAAVLVYMKGTYMVVGFQSEEYQIGTTVEYKCARLVPQSMKEKYAVFDGVPENWIPPEVEHSNDSWDLGDHGDRYISL